MVGVAFGTARIFVACLMMADGTLDDTYWGSTSNSNDAINGRPRSTPLSDRPS